jgi:hypothetical protein
VGAQGAVGGDAPERLGDQRLAGLGVALQVRRKLAGPRAPTPRRAVAGAGRAVWWSSRTGLYCRSDEEERPMATHSKTRHAVRRLRRLERRRREAELRKTRQAAAAPRQAPR